VDLLGKVLPEMTECMQELMDSRLKYSVLIDRVKRHGGITLRQALQADSFLDRLGILRDFE
jgi:hypothetical protein